MFGKVRGQCVTSDERPFRSFQEKTASLEATPDHPLSFEKEKNSFSRGFISYPF
jgi:hypothetical protein